MSKKDIVTTKYMRQNEIFADAFNFHSGEFLSGFTKQDRLLPVVTLVLHFGSKSWDGPLSLHDMFRDYGQEVLLRVPDYKINLISPSQIPEEDFSKFQTSLGQVLQFMKHADDKARLAEVLDCNPNFRKLGREEVDVLNTCINAGITIKEEEEEVDVCKAIKEMMEDAREVGISQGIATGDSNRLIWTIKKLMEKQHWSAEEAMDCLDIPHNERVALTALL